MKQKEAETILLRLMEASGVKNEAALAAVIGISHQAVYNAKKKGVIPPGWAHAIAMRYGVSTDWLFFGTGDKCRVDESGEESGSGPEFSGRSAPAVVGGYRDVPVTGLANCGLRGWFSAGPVALRCSVLTDNSAPNLFAVIALGASMQPEGIREGFVVICDPDKPAAAGDAVFIERRDGAAGIKLYKGEDAEWLELQGWLEPKEDGSQKPYSEQLRKSAVRRIAVVVMVKRKA